MVVTRFLPSVLVILHLVGGCSIYPARYVLVNSAELGSRGDVPLINRNDSVCSTQIAEASATRKALRRQIHGTIEQAGTLRVKYHPLYATNRCMVVEGSIGGSKRKYPVLLDTGASQGVLVNDIHVLENKLPILDKVDSRGQPLGLCHVTELRMGQVTLANLACWYVQGHLELEFFGLPIARDDSIIVGLTALREFKYIVFDSMNREVEFSRNQAFLPGNKHGWSKYPLSIREDKYGNAFAFVEVPIAGEPMEVQLDTGSGNGLAISEKLWEALSPRVEKARLKDGVDLYPYIGRLPCRRGIIPRLEVGDREIRDAKISVFPSNSPLLSECKAVLGMQYFQDTVMVLDFQDAIMWVKNPQD